MNFTGTDGIDPDFIVSNYYYEGNPKYLKKYNIPDNYEKIYSLKKTLFTTPAAAAQTALRTTGGQRYFNDLFPKNISICNENIFIIK